MYLFHEIKDFKTVNHLAKYSVQSVQMWLLCITYEELASISIGATIGHWKYPSCIVLENRGKGKMCGPKIRMKYLKTILTQLTD